MKIYVFNDILFVFLSDSSNSHSEPMDIDEDSVGLYGKMDAVTQPTVGLKNCLEFLYSFFIIYWVTII